MNIVYLQYIYILLFMIKEMINYTKKYCNTMNSQKVKYNKTASAVFIITITQIFSEFYKLFHVLLV